VWKERHEKCTSPGIGMGESMTLYGVNATETITLLNERALESARGEERSDSRKTALIVEGGAMRGVISCAALLGLEELGMTEVFDEVYGASAGAVNAAYFLAGQASYATSIYYQKVNNTRFIRRPWHRQILDIDDLFNSIVARERPLRVHRVLESGSQFFISIVDARTGEAFLAHAQKSGTPLLTLLKASSAMPLLYNGLVSVDGRDCFDGALLNPVPILAAIESGCTDLLVVLTRPASFRACPPSLLLQQLFEMRCARGSAQLMKEYVNTHGRENFARDVAFGRQDVPGDIRIATLCPDESDPRIERTTRNADLLKAAAMLSAKRTMEAFGQSIEEFVEVLRPFPAMQNKSAADCVEIA
jgi:predicted patatin/cPLA2 family phospholipase